MRYHLLLTLPIMLVACSGNEETTIATTTTSADTTAKAVALRPWPGFYEDTLACSDCEGLYTQLWVRSDSSFVRRDRYLGKDTTASGTIGSWKIDDGKLALMVGGTQLASFDQVEEGLQQKDVPGGPLDAAHPNTLEKLADEIQDEIPRMKVTGTFTYMADAMSFTPCGANRSWPCAGGEEWTDEGEAQGSLNTRELERHYLRSVKQGGDPWTIEAECSLAMGPAMEGDGADEYIFIHRVLKSGASCP
ncbi:MAG: copper resistance protein NlpE N-terminal domain-containing protein [Flavobacteriales bacterium]|nr:copper resistance protein NlpE N-terminal domain-containing protein [Flavobacteriales bacterium]